MAQLRVPQQYPTIQAAVDAANGGDTILIDSGAYVESVELRPEMHDLTIAGRGNSTRLYAPVPGTGIGISNAGNRGVTVRDLALADFEFAVVDAFSQESTYENLTAVARSACFATLLSAGCRMRGLVGTADDAGILIYNAVDAVVERSELKANVGQFEYGTMGSVSTQNRFDANGAAGFIGSNITGGSHSRNLYSFNQLDGFAALDSSGLSVAGNTFRSNGGHGLRLAGGRRNSVTGNETRQNRGVGMLLAGELAGEVVGNVARQNGQGGLRLIDSSQTVVRENRLRSNDPADLIVAGGAENTIADNGCDRSVPPGLCGG